MPFTLTKHWMSSGMQTLRPSACPVTTRANVCLRVYSRGLQDVFNLSRGSEQVPPLVHNSVTEGTAWGMMLSIDD